MLMVYIIHTCEPRITDFCLSILRFQIWNYFFYLGISDEGLIVSRSKFVGDVPRTAVGTFYESREVRFPGSVSTEGWNINQDGSIVGHYDSQDGRRHGFIARPSTEAIADYFGNIFDMRLAKGLNMISVPLQPPETDDRQIARWIDWINDSDSS